MSADLAQLEKVVASLSDAVAAMGQFQGRLMTGYESSNRLVAQHAEMLAVQVKLAHEGMAKALEMQLRLAEERELLLSQNHYRELEAESAKQRSKAFQTISTDVRAIVMLGLKRALGIPLSGNDTHGFKDFLATMTGDQIDKLMAEGVLELTEGQRHGLAAMFTSIAEAEQKKLAPPPEAEAAE